MPVVAEVLQEVLEDPAEVVQQAQAKDRQLLAERLIQAVVAVLGMMQQQAQAAQESSSSRSINKRSHER
jgi:hypothetical protein